MKCQWTELNMIDMEHWVMTCINIVFGERSWNVPISLFIGLQYCAVATQQRQFLENVDITRLQIEYYYIRHDKDEVMS